ncbi:MAG: Gfo/Idh/MocA family protein [Chthoniobacterales bacterium]
MRFGLIGAGCIGQLRARALRKVEGASLVAVADVESTRAAMLARPAGAMTAASAADLLGVDSIDAVIVSTPPPFHEEAAVASLRAGKHVLCEKPLSNSVEACRRMVDAAGDNGKMLATGFNHRFFPAVQFLKKTVAAGVIGKLNHVRAFAGHEGLTQFRAAWEYEKNVIGGGALMDVGIHIIDLTAHILGDVREVFGIATGSVFNLTGSEDNGFGLLRSSNGAVATLHASWTEWKGYRFYIEAYGDRGMVRAFYAPMMNMLITKEAAESTPRRRFKFYPAITMKEKLFGWQDTVVETFRQEISEFMALCGGGRAEQIADGRAGLRAVEIANAIYRSSAEGQPITLSSGGD